MPTLRLSVKEAVDYFAPKGPLATQMRAAATKGMLSAALRAKRDIVARVIPSFGGRKPIDRGIYRAGWQVERMPFGAAIYNPVPTAAMIEDGVPANNVVASNKAHVALAEWVQRKLGGRRQGQTIKSTKGKTDAGSSADEKADGRINAAKERFDKAKAAWPARSKIAVAKGKPPPPRPKKPAILTSAKRAGFDDSYAWHIAGAILAAMKKRGIFDNGKGLKILTNYVRSSLPTVMREEIERELGKVTK